jgi:hypothetical protein
MDISQSVSTRPRSEMGFTCFLGSGYLKGYVERFSEAA